MGDPLKHGGHGGGTNPGAGLVKCGQRDGQEPRRILRHQSQRSAYLGEPNAEANEGSHEVSRRMVIGT